MIATALKQGQVWYEGNAKKTLRIHMLFIVKYSLHIPLFNNNFVIHTLFLESYHTHIIYVNNASDIQYLIYY
jgi:hypothetical protein